MFGAELAALAADHPGYRLLVRATRSQGRLDLTRLDEEVPDWRERQTWACGPEGMLNQAEQRMVGGGHRRPAALGAIRGVAGGARRSRRNGHVRPQRAAP